MRLRIICFFLILFILVSKCPKAQDTLHICEPGDLIQLSTIEGAFLYSWEPAFSLDNPTIFNPIARPSENTTYIVEIVSAVVSENLVVNADFSLGNTGFVSDYPFVNSISTQGVFGIDVSAQNLNGIFFEDCPDKTSGNGLMMVVDGSPIANEKVWCQTLDVSPQTDYAFSSWLTSVNPQNPAKLIYSINGEILGDIFTASSRVCEWRQFYELWNSGTADTAQICIVNQNTNPAGNDFALDDFGFFELDEILYDTFHVVVDALNAAEQQNIYIPNVFSPNEDGINDKFEVLSGKGVDAVESVQIFDRWGNLISSDLLWDGNHQGTQAVDDVYVYAVVVLFSNGVRRKFSGSLKLIR